MPVCEKTNVEILLEKSIEKFCEVIEKSNRDYHAHCCLHETPPFENLLEIDTDGIGEDGKSYLKVINNLTQDAFAVTLDTIVTHHKDESLESVVRALQTGIFNRVYGVTRIVGYYSRTVNWNKSKISELNDRHAGNYLWKDKPENKTEDECVGDLCHV